MKLYAVRIRNATPPVVLTADPADVTAWLATGDVVTVHELEAAQTYPVSP